MHLTSSLHYEYDSHMSPSPVWARELFSLQLSGNFSFPRSHFMSILVEFHPVSAQAGIQLLRKTPMLIFGTSSFLSSPFPRILSCKPYSPVCSTQQDHCAPPGLPLSALLSNTSLYAASWGMGEFVLYVFLLSEILVLCRLLSNAWIQIFYIIV